MPRPAAPPFARLAAAVLVAVAGALPAAPAIDPGAETLLRALTNRFAGVTSARVSAETSLQAANQPGEAQRWSQQTAIQRPNLYARFVQHPRVGVTEALLCDGEHLFLYSGQLNAFERRKAPELFDPIVGGDPLAEVSLLGILMAANAYDRLTSEALTITGPLPSTFESKPTRTLLIDRTDSDWTLHLSTEDPPTPVALVFQSNSQPMTMTTAMRRWTIDQRLPKGTFTFNPPAGSRRVANMQKALLEAASGKQEPGSLEGTEAPDFTLPRYGEGEPVSLSSLRGKPVMLDFWATWCGPCRVGMPMNLRLARKYAPDGLQFHAINLRETPHTIQRYLEREKLTDLPILLDRKGEVGLDYGVEGIPLLVLIRADGTIAKMHVGVVPEELLEGDIRRLLGKGPEGGS